MFLFLLPLVEIIGTTIAYNVLDDLLNDKN